MLRTLYSLNCLVVTPMYIHIYIHRCVFLLMFSYILAGTLQHGSLQIFHMQYKNVVASTYMCKYIFKINFFRQMNIIGTE